MAASNSAAPGPFRGLNSPLGAFDRVLVSTADSPFDGRVLVGTIVDATVSGVGNAMSDFQLKVLKPAATPDDETAGCLIACT